MTFFNQNSKMFCIYRNLNMITKKKESNFYVSSYPIIFVTNKLPLSNKHLAKEIWLFFVGIKYLDYKKKSPLSKSFAPYFGYIRPHSKHKRKVYMTTVEWLKFLFICRVNESSLHFQCKINTKSIHISLEGNLGKIRSGVSKTVWGSQAWINVNSTQFIIISFRNTTVMPLLYSVISRGTTVLAKYAECVGNFAEVTEQIMTKISSDNHKLTYSHGSYLIHYICEDRIIYMCITDDVSVAVRFQLLWHSFLEVIVINNLQFFFSCRNFKELGRSFFWRM